MEHPTAEELKRWAERSKIAQNKAWDEQAIEFEQRLEERIDKLKCIGCKKTLEFEQHGDKKVHGCFYGGGLLIDSMGFGSRKFDMAKIGILVCDECVAEHAVTSSWLDKLSKHSR